METCPLVSLIVPFYNEGEGVDIFHQTIRGLMDQIASVCFEVVCVDDGSRDDTLDRLRKVAGCDSRFRVIELSRNFGKEAALTAGIDAALGDAVIPMDADLQDSPELIGQMITEWQAGADVVLAKRSDREVDTFLKRQTAKWFYHLHNKVSSVEIPENVGDFRLLNREAVEALKSLPEQQRFMKGLFAWIGFKTVTLEYKRQERAAGTSKFSAWKLWNFAIEGITSFSTAPLRVWTYIGVVIASMTLAYAVFTIIKTLVMGIGVPGYASLLVAILFLGSLQLISIGVLGEYIGRIYIESKRRPRYIVRKVYQTKESADARENPEK